MSLIDFLRGARCKIKMYQNSICVWQTGGGSVCGGDTCTKCVGCKSARGALIVWPIDVLPDLVLDRTLGR